MLVIKPEQQHALLVRSATFEWDAPVDKAGSTPMQEKSRTVSPFALRDINLEVSRGSLVAVIGPVASGKSSLLQGLVGAMRRTAGEVGFCGRVAYCQQDAWIQRGTIVSLGTVFLLGWVLTERAAR